MHTLKLNPMKSALSLAGMLWLAFAGLAMSETILIDWATTTSLVTDGDGNQWNSIGNNGADPVNAALVNTTGTATSVTVTVSTGGGAGSGWGDFNGAAGPDPYDEAAVHDDGVFNGGTSPLPITFSGLAANTEYFFTAINRRAASGRDGRITITVGTSTDIGAGIVLTLNGPVLSFSATSNASGVIALGFAENTSGTGGAVLNGITLSGESVPVTPPAGPRLSAFTYDPVTGDSEVSLKGTANTDYKLVEAANLDFTLPDQNPIPLHGATVGLSVGDYFTTDASGNATVQFNLGTDKNATFIRAETFTPDQSVTEVYLFGGQSNMTQEVVDSFLADMRAASPGKTIAAVNFTKGATGLDSRWNASTWIADPATAADRVNFYPGTNGSDPATGTAYAEMIAAWQAGLGVITGNYVIKGFGWVHGERDAIRGESAAAYGANLAHLIQRVHEDMGVPVGTRPFLYSTMWASAPNYTTYGPTLRQQMLDLDHASGLPAAVANAFVVDASGLTYQSDNLHYDGPSRVVLGSRFADKMLNGTALALPQVLIIGDSISGGYYNSVVNSLQTEAAVSRNPGNGEWTGTGIIKIDEWLGSVNWDVIHFNWGLWDIYGWRYAAEDRSPAAYAQRLETLVTRMEQTGAKLIWATTTPVTPEPEATMLEKWGTEVIISPDLEQQYRDAALGVMNRHNVQINDLYTVIKPNLAIYSPDPTNVHFNGAGYGVLAGEVTKAIRLALAAPAPPGN